MNTDNTRESSADAVIPSARTAPSPAMVGDKLPKAMGTGDMIRAFGISARTFYRREGAGEFRPFLLPRPMGTKRYSGEKVQHFLDGRSR